MDNQSRHIQHQLSLQISIHELKIQSYISIIKDTLAFTKIFLTESNYTLAICSQSGKSKSDPSIFNGAGGYLIAFLKMYDFIKWVKVQNDQNNYIEQAKQHFSDENLAKFFDENFYLNHAKQCYAKLCTYLKKNKNIGFFFGNSGIYYLGCILSYHINDSQTFNDNIQKIRQEFEYIKQNIDSQYGELLYGIAGFLNILNGLQRRFSQDDTPQNFKINIEDMVYQLIIFIYQSGSSTGQIFKEIDQGARLQYFFFQKEYLGGAHGLSGVLKQLMTAIAFNQKWKSDSQITQISDAIQKSLTSLVSQQLNSGNFPPQYQSKQDNLVQFCHGSPGIVTTLIQSYEMYKNESFLKSAEKGLKNIFEMGLLKKGFGLCHGISGNAQALLVGYIQLKDEKYLKQAHLFLNSKNDENIMKTILTYDFPDRYKIGVSDYPYSYMEGLAGDLCFQVDLLMEKSEMIGFD